MNRRNMLAWLASPATIALAQKKVTDDQIYDQVRLKLAGDPDVKGGALKVEVKDGFVTVKGIVDTPHARDKVEHLVKKVKGVTGVKNLVEVKPAGIPR